MDWIVFGYRVLLTVFLIGSVIFIHELGHFLVARWCGVFVERFSLGFGPVLLRWKGQETEYVLSAIPLGGYVQMKGQTDTPEVEVVDDDPRNYQNRPVWQRMAIISAGVFMNVVYAFVLFTAAYLMGVTYRAGVVGAATPGMPAWEAGLRPGDRLVAVDGEPTDDFDDIRRASSSARPGKETIRLAVDRPAGDGKFERKEFAVTAFKGKKNMMPQVGLGAASSLKIAFTDDGVEDQSPAAKAGLLPNDRIVAIDGAKLADAGELDLKLYDARGRAVKLTLLRPKNKQKPGVDEAEVAVELAANQVRTLGLVMEIGRIAAVQADSPGAAALDAATGQPLPLAPNDVIKAIDGVEDFDPLRLPDLLAAKAGQKVELRLVREGRQTQEILVQVVPARATPWTGFQEGGFYIGEDEKPLLALPGLGAALEIRSTVRKVAPDSPAAKAGIVAGDTVVEAAFRERSKAKTVRKLAVDGNWPHVFWNLQNSGIDAETTLKVRRKGAAANAEPDAIVLTAVPDPDWPLHLRGLPLQGEARIRKAGSFGEAVAISWKRTITSGRHLYAILRQLATGNISVRSISGPLSIFDLVYKLTMEPLADLFVLLAFININLAVINFLPVFILDGGHMVLLLYELIFRRRPPERVVFVLNLIGFALIGTLMAFALFQDFRRFVFEKLF